MFKKLLWISEGFQVVPVVKENKKPLLKPMQET